MVCGVRGRRCRSFSVRGCCIFHIDLSIIRIGISLPVLASLFYASLPFGSLILRVIIAIPEAGTCAKALTSGHLTAKPPNPHHLPAC